MPENTTPPPRNFEQALHELEEIVGQLEAGDRPLEESLELYEKGIAALKHCHVILDRAEKRIRLLVRNHRGEPELEEAPVPGSPPPPRPADKGEKPEEPTVVSAEPAAPGEPSKKSSQRPIDARAALPQNGDLSVKPKQRGAPPEADAGGSLFGHSQ